ncbi:MAG: nucleotide sugar dehydrogenase, partial [Burkholderiaceae bacterium]|nr:nucleotide sugar dehydrogenase [Burkholderiaceae bacterium]
THKAEMLGYHPQVILAGRRINDGMGAFIAQRLVKEMIAAGFGVRGEPIIVFGLTFKEDVPDLRNSKVIDVIRELRSYGAAVCVHDPVADPDHAMHEYGVSLTAWEALPRAAAAVMAVPHAALRERGVEAIAARLLPGAVLADVKSVFPPAAVTAAGLRLWRL